MREALFFLAICSFVLFESTSGCADFSKAFESEVALWSSEQLASDADSKIAKRNLMEFCGCKNNGGKVMTIPLSGILIFLHSTCMRILIAVRWPSRVDDSVDSSSAAVSDCPVSRCVYIDDAGVCAPVSDPVKNGFACCLGIACCN